MTHPPIVDQSSRGIWPKSDKSRGVPSHYLRLALAEAAIRQGRTPPNPAVGAVVVRGGEVVATGFHWGAGFPHAEVVAIERAGEQARGATLYVTLEPCCHFGRTPPCTGLIRESGIARVVYGYGDPNPLVAGGGHSELNDAGIPCELLALPETAAFYESYQHWTLTGLPWVTAKLALSLDGRIAGPGGQPVRLTGAQAAAQTHLARERTDAILTTVRTVTADNPRLDARCADRILPRPLFILDSRARFPLEAQLWKTAQSLVLFYGPEAATDRVAALTARGAQMVELAADERGLSLEAAIRWIGKQGYHSLWVEGGGRLFQSLLRGKHLNRARVYLAPAVLGEGISAFLPSDTQLSAARSVRWSSAGRDALGEFEFGE